MVAFAWHVHHDTLVELLTEPIEVRRAFIRENKPGSEQELRLRLLHEVQGVLPSSFAEARAVYDKARASFAEALAVYEKVGAVYDKALAAYTEARASFAEALASFAEALAVYEKARAVYDKALAAYTEARDASYPAILVLHTQECPDCPWNGETIFEGEGKEP